MASELLSDEEIYTMLRTLDEEYKKDHKQVTNILKTEEDKAKEMQNDPVYPGRIVEEYSNQEAKADNGKPKITLVPRQIIWDIAEVREYGNKKYGSPDNWKNVEPERYRDALCRHFLKYLDDPNSVDEESGIKHLKHMACNIAFLCEMEDKNESTNNLGKAKT